SRSGPRSPLRYSNDTHNLTNDLRRDFRWTREHSVRRNQHGHGSWRYRQYRLRGWRRIGSSVRHLCQLHEGTAGVQSSPQSPGGRLEWLTSVRVLFSPSLAVSDGARYPGSRKAQSPRCHVADLAGRGEAGRGGIISRKKTDRLTVRVRGPL